MTQRPQRVDLNAFNRLAPHTSIIVHQPLEMKLPYRKEKKNHVKHAYRSFMVESLVTVKQKSTHVIPVHIHMAPIISQTHNLSNSKHSFSRIESRTVATTP